MKVMAPGKALEWPGVNWKTRVGELAVGPVVLWQQLLAAGATHNPGAQVWTWLRSSPAPWPGETPSSAARWWVWLQLGEETEGHFQNKLRVDTLLPLAHHNSPSKSACFKSTDGSGAPKVGSLLGETPVVAGMRKEDMCWEHDTH